MVGYPRVFGRYRIERKLATGGMAEVFLGTLAGPEGFQKRVAIKRLLPQWSSDPEFFQMLVEEAKLVVQLTDPQIVQVLELGQEKDEVYLAMEFVDGVDLRSLLAKTGPLAAEIALTIMQGCLKALKYAHSKSDPAGHPLGIIHRDVSPQNILLSFDGQVKLADFGIARAASRSRKTASGILKGKFAYMSPEQALGQVLDERSDLFSAGIVYYEMVTGRELFKGKSDLEILEKVRRVDGIPALLATLPRESAAVLEKALARDPAERFGTAQEFLRAIESLGVQYQFDFGPEPLARLLALHRGDWSRQETAIAITQARRGTSRWWGLSLLLLIAIPLKDRLGKGGGVSGEFPEVSWEAQGHGYLNVQAVPWGEVSIGSVEGMETPVARLPVPAGIHQLKVFFAPKNQTLTATVRMPVGGEVGCIADFDSGKLECK